MNASRQNPFFSFDGVDGAGKSTQISRFVEWLRGLGHEVVACRDPGTTRLGEKLREILLHEHELAIDPRSEALIYMAARAQLVREFIQPQLNQGRIVVSDRFQLANVVYQGYGLGLEPQAIWQVGAFATGDTLPTRTFYLDLDPLAARSRQQGRADRVEQRDADYFRRLREGYLHEAQLRPREITVIDASQNAESVARDIQQAAAPLLPKIKRLT